MVIWPDVTQDFGSPCFVLAICIAIDEEQADSLTPLLKQGRGGLPDLIRIDLGRHLTAGQGPLSHLKAALPFNDWRELSPQSPGCWPVAATHFQHISEARSGDDACLGALALKKGVGRDSGAMDDGRYCTKLISRGLDAAQEPG